MRSRSVQALLLALLSLLFAACEAEVATTIDADRLPAATVQLQLSGEAAAAVAGDASLLAQLNDLFKASASSDVRSSVSPERVTLAADIADVAAAAPLVGVGGATLTDGTLRVEFVVPERLLVALDTAGDAAPLLRQQVVVTVTVAGEGTVASASSTSVLPRVDGSSVSFSAAAGEWSAGSATVVFDDGGRGWWWPAAAVGAAGAVGAVWWFSRRR